jgi:hypothetical protein
MEPQIGSGKGCEGRVSIIADAKLSKLITGTQGSLSRSLASAETITRSEKQADLEEYGKIKIYWVPE